MASTLNGPAQEETSQTPPFAPLSAGMASSSPPNSAMTAPKTTTLAVPQLAMALSLGSTVQALAHQSVSLYVETKSKS